MTTGQDTSGDYLESFLTSAFGDVKDDPFFSSALQDDEAPASVGRFRVVGTIGKGGMGIVYRVEDDELGRDLAVKVLRRRHAADAELRRRFIEESRICSRLQHPGVVPVHEIGRLEDGRPFFTMKIVDGETFDERLGARRPSREDARRELEVLAKIAQTLAYAHAHDVVHGDMKPQNIMLGAFGEVQLMDWGFARGPESPVATTRPRVIGTPAYMAPEQSRGDPDLVDARTDVFGLGAILCEILCGSAPYLAPSKEETCALAASGDLTDARRRLQASREDSFLTELSLRCMNADAAGRPADGAAFAREIESYLDGLEQRARALEVEAAEARAVAAGERRSRRLSVALTVAIAAGVAVSAAILIYVERDRSARSADVESRVAAAVERASMLRRDARESIDDRMAIWARASAAANEASLLARSPDATERTREFVARFDTEIESEARTAATESRLLHQLASLRPHLGDDRSSTTLDAAYRAVFAECGIDVAGGDRDTYVEVLRSSPIRDALVDALDEWVHHRRRIDGEESAAWHEMLAIASLADRDPWRREMRDAYEHADVERLRVLAEADVTRAISPIGLDLLARCLLERGDKPASMELFRRAARLHPGDFWIHHNLASELNTVDPRPSDEILRHLHMALAIRPNSAHAQTDLGLEFMVQGQAERAIAALSEARRLEPEYRRAAFLLADLYTRLGRPFLAAPLCREAIDGGMKAARNALVQCLVMSGRAGEALEFAYEQIAADPTDGAAHYFVAALLTDDHRPEEALVHIEKTLTLAPDHQVVLGVKAVALWKSGDFEGAVTALRAGAERPGFPDVYRRMLPQYETYVELLPTLALARRDAEPPLERDSRLALAEMAIPLGAPEVATRLLDAEFKTSDARDDATLRFLAATAWARMETPEASARTLEHLSAAIDIAERSATTPPAALAVLPMFRSWALEPSISKALGHDDEGAALSERLETLRSRLHDLARGER